MRWQPCKRHDGKHQDVHGQCVHWGAPAALRPGHCPEAGCGEEVMRRLDLSSGRVTTLEAGSDLPHTHTAPIRVELDPDAIAYAIVSASRMARQERPQQVNVQPEQQTPYIRPPQRNGTSLGGIPRLEE